MNANNISNEERSELMKKVIALQNHPANVSRDHVSITGFFTTRDQFEFHLLHLENAALTHKP